MTTGVRAGMVAALALRQVARGDSRRSLAAPEPEAPSLDSWLNTLHALARKRVEQREDWAAEARLRLAMRARRQE